jgi:hypothetical protein
MMENTPTRARSPLAKLRAWLRGDRHMVDSRAPTPVVTEPPAAPAPATGAQAPAKQD